MNNRINELAGEIISSLNREENEREERIINILTAELSSKNSFPDIMEAFQNLCFNWSRYKSKMNKIDLLYYKSFMGLSSTPFVGNEKRIKTMLQKAGYTLKWQAPE